MKSEFFENRETLGSMVLNTQADWNKEKIEVGDIAVGLNKYYIKALNEAKENHIDKIDSFYIQVIWDDTGPFKYRMKKFTFVSRKTEPMMEDDMDCWFIDYKKDITRLEWSIPHWSIFDRVLKNPNEYSAKLVADVKFYKSHQKK